MGVKLTVAPRQRGIVDGVIQNAVIGERHQHLLLDGEGQPPFKDEIVVAQRQNIGLIGAVRGRGQPEQEAGLEVV